MLNISIKNSAVYEYGLIWAIAASLLLHALLAVFVPNLKFDVKKETKQVLKIELQKPSPPAPVIAPPLPVSKPEPLKPEPIKPKIKPKPTVKPKPIVTEPEFIEPPETAPPITNEVIAVQPSAEIQPEVVVAQPAPVETPPPPPPNKDAALGDYRSILGRAIAKHKSYPKIAQRRGWQGTVLLNIKVDENGNVLSATVSKSSGHKSLDKQALKMVKKASPFPTPPSALRGSSFNITVPVSFKLAGA